MWKKCMKISLFKVCILLVIIIFMLGIFKITLLKIQSINMVVVDADELLFQKDFNIVKNSFDVKNVKTKCKVNLDDSDFSRLNDLLNEYNVLENEYIEIVNELCVMKKTKGSSSSGGYFIDENLLFNESKLYINSNEYYYYIGDNQKLMKIFNNIFYRNGKQIIEDDEVKYISIFVENKHYVLNRALETMILYIKSHMQYGNENNFTEVSVVVVDEHFKYGKISLPLTDELQRIIDEFGELL